jgi:hypothetical protein
VGALGDPRAPLRVGNVSAGTHLNLYAGPIDEVALHSTVLSDDTIANHYRTGTA